MTPFRQDRAVQRGSGAVVAWLDGALLQLVDAGLAACIFLVPMLMGGRHALGQLVLVALAFTVAVAWTLRQCLGREFQWRRSPAEWLLAAGLALLLLQLFPVSESLLARISPHTAAILPLWTSQADPAAALGVWPCVSLTPGATRAAVPLFLAYGLLILVTVQRIESIEHVERILRWIALSAFAMASFGLVQWATCNGCYFWFYEHPFSSATDSVKGSFTNRNHFAHFLALGLGPLIVWIGSLRAGRPQPAPIGAWRAADPRNLSPMRLLALGIVLFAGLMSLSRGGAIAIFVAAAVSIAACYRARTLGTRFVLGLAAMALLTVAALWIYGLDHVSDRLGDLTSSSLDALDNHQGRRAIWAADLKASPDYWLLGAGVGSHAEIYPMTMDPPVEHEYTHAENGPIQLLLETGVTGLGLMSVAIGLCAFWCIGALRAGAVGERSGRRLVSAEVPRRGVTTMVPGLPGSAASGGGSTRPGKPAVAPGDAVSAKRVLLCAGAVSAGLAASVTHAMVDFVWYVPACMMLVAIMAACACRVRQLAVASQGRRLEPVALPRAFAVALALALTVGGTWMVAGQFGRTMAQIHWEQYLILDLAANRTVEADRNRPATTPASGYDPAAPASVVQRIDQLEQVVQWDSSDARAHLRLAGTYLRHFDLVQQASENAMPLSQISDAALAAGFTSREAVQEWLSRAIGDGHRDLGRAWEHARRAVGLAPTQGEGYLYLAQLCFLGGPQATVAKKAYLAQALRVRPFDGTVLFEAGKDASLAGDVPRALDYWRMSFRNSASHRNQLIELLAGRVPIGFFLEGLQPDLDALRTLHTRYTVLATPEQRELLRAIYLQNTATESRNAEQDAAAATAWLRGQLAELRVCFLRAAQIEAERLDGRPSAFVWLEIAGLQQQMGDPASGLQSLEKAIRADPNHFRVRYSMAVSLADAGRFEEAQTHANWCIRKKPDDRDLQTLVRNIAKKRIDRGDRTAGDNPSTKAMR